MLLSDLNKMSDADLVAELEKIVYHEFEETEIADEFASESAFFLDKAKMRELRNITDALEYRFIIQAEQTLQSAPPESEEPEPAA